MKCNDNVLSQALRRIISVCFLLYWLSTKYYGLCKQRKGFSLGSPEVYVEQWSKLLKQRYVNTIFHLSVVETIVSDHSGKIPAYELMKLLCKDEGYYWDWKSISFRTVL